MGLGGEQGFDGGLGVGVQVGVRPREDRQRRLHAGSGDLPEGEADAAEACVLVLRRLRECRHGRSGAEGQDVRCSRDAGGALDGIGNAVQAAERDRQRPRRAGALHPPWAFDVRQCASHRHEQVFQRMRLGVERRRGTVDDRVPVRRHASEDPADVDGACAEYRRLLVVGGLERLEAFERRREGVLYQTALLVRVPALRVPPHSLDLGGILDPRGDRGHGDGERNLEEATLAVADPPLDDVGDAGARLLGQLGEHGVRVVGNRRHPDLVAPPGQPAFLQYALEAPADPPGPVARHEEGRGVGHAGILPPYAARRCARPTVGD